MTGSAAPWLVRRLRALGLSAADAAKVATGQTSGTDLSGLTADGQPVVYSSALGRMTQAAASGAVLLASAKNITGTTTSAATTGGAAGPQVTVPGTSISISTSNGLPAVIRWGATWQQTVAGTGLAIINLVETTGAATVLRASYSPLPNSTTTPLCFFSCATHDFEVGTISSTRTFELRAQLWSPAGQTPTAVLFNNATNPTYIRAVTGI